MWYIYISSDSWFRMKRALKWDTLLEVRCKNLQSLQIYRIVLNVNINVFPSASFVKLSGIFYISFLEAMLALNLCIHLLQKDERWNKRELENLKLKCSSKLGVDNVNLLAKSKCKLWYLNSLYFLENKGISKLIWELCSCFSPTWKEKINDNYLLVFLAR